MTQQTSTGHTAALTKEVAGIWQRVLNLRHPVTPEANFVALGGDSLLLMAILDEVEDAYGVELDVDAVLADLSVAGMVRALQSATPPGGSGA